MKFKKGILAAMFVATLATVFAPMAAMANDNKDDSRSRGWWKYNRPTETIVDIVLRDDGEFDVLQAAVVKAGLVDALNGNNKLTVFAPTDAAFIKTLGVADEAAAISTVESLPVDALTDILLYHVTEGNRGALSVIFSRQYPMLNGDMLSRYELFQAGIEKVNVRASNGVIHVIGSVLLPS